MKKTCGTVVFREYDLDRTLDAIYAAGYRYFETQATNPWCNHVVLDKDDRTEEIGIFARMMGIPLEQVL